MNHPSAILKLYLLFATITLISCQFNRTITKVIINTDPGPDDALAILFTLLTTKLNPGIEILAITTTFGNSNNNNSVINALKILDQTGDIGRIPVYPGAQGSILETPPDERYFGTDGFSDFEYPNPPTFNESEPTLAVNALIFLVNQYPGEVTLLSLGPLTNIALAQRLDPTFFSKLDNLFILGGKVGELPADFNFSQDPESNWIVLDESEKLKRPAVLLTTNTSAKIRNATDVILNWRKNVFGKIDSPLVRFLNEVDGYVATGKPWGISDGLLTVTVLNPSLAKEVNLYEANACIQPMCRGLVKIHGQDPARANIEIIETVDATGFFHTVYQVFSKK